MTPSGHGSEDDRIGGSYPGGPSRSDEKDAAEPVRRRRDLTPAEEIESRAQDGRSARVRQRRRRRVAIGFVVALAVAGIVGFWLGMQSHRSAAEIAREQEAEARDRGFDLGAESDHLLQQLWLMEDLERARQP